MMEMTEVRISEFGDIQIENFQAEQQEKKKIRHKYTSLNDLQDNDKDTTFGSLKSQKKGKEVRSQKFKKVKEQWLKTPSPNGKKTKLRKSKSSVNLRTGRNTKTKLLDIKDRENI